MKTECPKCAMSVDAQAEKCSFCGAALVAKRAEPKIEKTGSAWTLGCLAPFVAFLVLLEVSLVIGSFRHDADANVTRVWALLFGVLTFAAVRKLWGNLR